MRPIFQWDLGSRSLELGRRTLIMGILNVTPDSFSDGGEFLDPQKALKHATRLLEEGADIVDIGGESTRPGASVNAGVPPKSELHDASSGNSADGLSAEQELQRVLPVINAVKKEHPSAIISVDTYKAEVARAAVNAGAEIVNDVSGFRWDPQMIGTLANLQCGAILMHMRGRPTEWRSLPPPHDVIHLVKRELTERAQDALSAGMLRERIVLDPGFGFGKSFDQNYPLIAHFAEFHRTGFPLIAGTSRKSFIGRTMGGEKNIAPADRLFGTLASETALILSGAHIIRTHDVKPSLQAARVADAILRAS
jgi:dihydropteroate synthase